MILSAGLSPAWQQILSFRQLMPGEVNRATSAAWCASGKVLNVGCALHHLGVSSKTLCLVGGPAGEQVRADFEQLQIPVRWIKSHSATRICTTILDLSSAITTELVENCRPIADSELTAFFDAFADEARTAQVVVLTGSLPQGVPSNFFSQLLETTSAKAVLDIRGAELDAALAQRPFVVKPNREELARTVGRNIETDEDLVAAMSNLRDRGAEWVVISNGSRPLLALGPDGMIRIDPPRVTVCNPIGCGDCLAAGIAAGIFLGKSMYDSLEIGVRAATENVQELLPARCLTKLI